MVCFLNIHYFQKDLTIYEKGPARTPYSFVYDGSSYESRWTGELHVHIFSLTKSQKTIAVTLFFLAILTLIVGAASISGINSISQEGAYLMIGMGSSLAGVISGLVSINHLIFKKQVDAYLSGERFNQPKKMWEKDENYCPAADAKYTFIFNNDKSRGIRYTTEPRVIVSQGGTEQIFGVKKWHIDFYRTETIRNERISCLNNRIPNPSLPLG